MTAPSLSLRDGFTVLFVEDNPLVAIYAEDILNALGVSRVETARTIEAARLLIESGGTDAAFLNLKLGDQSSLEIAELLMARNVPFAFATGYSDTREMPEKFTGVLVLEKPYTAQQVKDVLSRLISTQQDGS